MNNTKQFFQVDQIEHKVLRETKNFCTVDGVMLGLIEVLNLRFFDETSEFGEVNQTNKHRTRFCLKKFSATSNSSEEKIVRCKHI